MIAMNRLKVLTLLVSLVVASSARASLVTVRFEPSSQTVNLGDTFNVQIVADISSPVVGWGLDFAIASPPILSETAAPVIGAAWVPAPAPDGDGLASLAFPNSVSGTGVLLATLTLHANAIGATDLLLSVTPGDLTEGFALDPTGFAELTIQPGHANVVPEPSTIGLLALIGLGMLRGRPSRCRMRT